MADVEQNPQEQAPKTGSTWVEDKHGRRLKLDKRGLPLVPQPSDHKEDPLNWPFWLRLYTVMLVSGLAFISQIGASIINPAFVPMAADLGVTVQQASYCTTSSIPFNGLMPMLIVPFANIYGRRMLYLGFTFIAIFANVGSGLASTYGGVITGRVFFGIGSSISVGIGAATICDLFTQGDRGLYMGFYALAVTNAPHFSPIMGGAIAQNLNWRWCFFVPAMITSGFLVILIFTFPETLFSRDDFSKLEQQKTYFSKMFYFGKILDRRVKWVDFAHSFRMVRYAAVYLPCIFYATANTYGSILFGVTGAKIAQALYNFDTFQTGLLIGLPLMVGCMLGEASAGWFSDLLINFYAKRHGGYRKPEVRLYLIPLCWIMPIGVIAYGFMVQQARTWIYLAICMGIAGFGLQVSTTMTYTYCTDCYKPQSSEVSAVINLIRQSFAFLIGFYALPGTVTLGFDGAFGLYGAINFFSTIPLLYLVLKGEKIREKQGLPDFHQDL